MSLLSEPDKGVISILTLLYVICLHGAQLREVYLVHNSSKLKTVFICQFYCIFYVYLKTRRMVQKNEILEFWTFSGHVFFIHYSKLDEAATLAKCLSILLIN